MNVGLIGWRGMVGAVLMQRMREENDFRDIEARFFSTSQVGAPGPDIGKAVQPLADAYDVKALKAMDVLISCQGGEYTQTIVPQLRAAGWSGYWVDAASTLRLDPEAVIILDPVNRDVIDGALAAGIKTYVGGNCTVSLMLMAVGSLFRRGWVEWVSTMTYQSASGAGALNMKELLAQMAVVTDAAGADATDPKTPILSVDQKISAALRDAALPQAQFGAPLAASVLPWIDRAVDGGQTREEWKGHSETNKILGLDPPVPVDGICVRIPAMRCHSQGLTIKLTHDIALAEIETTLAQAHDWVRIVPNTKEATLRELTPAAVSGKLHVPVGRIHKLKLGPEYLGCFTVGDQLLWGAAEPLRRMLRILCRRRRHWD